MQKHSPIMQINVLEKKLEINQIWVRGFLNVLGELRL